MTNLSNQSSAASESLDKRRAASRRTAIILGVVAAGVFIAFFMRAVLLARGLN